MKLVWNAIVKDESAIIIRCVNSLLPYIDGAIILDTGSMDNTHELIQQAFDIAGKPLEYHYGQFVNFSQARNLALQKARDSKLDWDYLLLADADMELKVHKLDWASDLKGLSYDLKQTAGSLGYFNRRLVSRRATGGYVGVTHEYLDVDTAGTLDGAEFIDHADGFNRDKKLQRDIDLLETALKTETNQGLIQRYHFYLASTYYDVGDWNKAAAYYKLRAGMGGFEEEVWYAQLRYAMCLRNLGDEAGYVWNVLRAYELRPHRVESLHDLAKHFRERGDNRISLLFSEPGMSVPYPKDDLLFINNYVYNSGLKEEFAISAYYGDSQTLEQGRRVCDRLVFGGSEQARSNQYWYLEALFKHVPSFKPVKIPFIPADGYVAMNPSIVNRDGVPHVLVRSVNYNINERGEYEIRDSGGSYNRTNPIHTVNYLVLLDDRLDYIGSHELSLPDNWPDPKFNLVLGFEDSRLFEVDGWLWTLSTVRELTPEGWCEQVLAPLSRFGYGELWSKVTPKERRHEKNWMPWVRKDGVRFVYRLGTVIGSLGETIYHNPPDFDVSRISGGSQVIDVEGLPMALVHEARFVPGRPHNRYYLHRFVVFTQDGLVLRISPPFFFHDRQIEFAAGLAYFPEKRQLVASYGVCDREAWLATMDVDEVIAFLAEER